MKKQDKISLQRYQKQLELVASSSALNPFETLAEQRQAIERAKKDYDFMVGRYFPHYATASTPDFHIKFADRVAKVAVFKGMCVWGRASAKSVVNDIIIPFWLWLRGEPVYLVIIGNSSDRAKQLLEDIRAEFEANPQIHKDFGPQMNPGNWEEGFFITKGGFIGQALGMGQSVRGLRVKSKRPTHLVADDTETKDLLKNPKRMAENVRWIERDLIPTMDGQHRRYIHVNNRGAAVMMMTMLREKHPHWHWDQVNAYDPVTYEPAWKGKYTADYFRQMEKEIGQLAALAEFNNQPHVEGSIFKEEEVQWAPLPRLNSFKIIFGYWDVAYGGTATSDYNAVTVQGLKDRSFYVIDAFCRQSKMAAAVGWMCQYQKSLPESVVVHWVFESQFWNDAVRDAIAEGERLFNCRLNIIKRDRPKTGKYDRILTLQPYYQNGRIFFNEKLKHSNDLQVGLAQLYGIEPGYKGHDDWPDAHQGGIAELEKYVVYDSGRGAEIHSGKFNPSKHVI